jgi:hypothetical protein
MEDTMERRRVHDEVLACGYRKCCVKAEIFDDGSVVLSDDDVEGGSVGTLKLRPEAATRLLELLSEHKK